MEHPDEQAVFADLAQIERTLTEDMSGTRARRIIGYFEQRAKLGTALTGQVPDASDRHLESQLVQGMHASQRVVQHVWEALHSKPLAR